MKTNEASEHSKKKIGRFILLFIILVMILSNGALREKASSLLFKEDKTLEVIKEINLDPLNTYGLSVINSDIIIYGQEGFIVYDLDGNIQLTKNMDLKNSITAVGESNIYVINRESGNINAFKTDGSALWNHSLNRKVKHVFLRGNHLVTVALSEEGHQEIAIINSQGQQKVNIVINNGQAVSSDVFNECEEVIIGTIKAMEHKIISSLIKYSKAGELLWVEAFENEIIQDIRYLKDKSCILVTDKKIYHLNKHKELLWSRENNEDIWDITIDSSSQTMIVLYKNYLEIIDFNGRTKDKIGLSEGFERVEYYEGDIYLHNSRSILGIMENSKNLKYNSVEKISSIAITKENIILKLDNKIKIMGMARKN